MTAALDMNDKDSSHVFVGNEKNVPQAVNGLQSEVLQQSHPPRAAWVQHTHSRKITEFYTISNVKGLWLWSGHNRRIQSTVAYIHVSTRADILNKTRFMRDGDIQQRDDMSSFTVATSDGEPWIIWQAANTIFALDSRPSAPADFFLFSSPKHKHMHICYAAPTDTFLFVYGKCGSEMYVLLCAC